jgi:type VI secretion system FHA domain protein
MNLILEVTRYQGVKPIVPNQARFDEQGGDIGRGSNNKLVLADAEQVISRLHASVSYVNDGFVYNNVGQNGTKIGLDNRILLTGDSVMLAEGDLLKIGDYEIEVHIEMNEGSADKQPISDAFFSDFQREFTEQKVEFEPTPFEFEPSVFTTDQPIIADLAPVNEPAPVFDWLSWNDDNQEKPLAQESTPIQEPELLDTPDHVNAEPDFTEAEKPLSVVEFTKQNQPVQATSIADPVAELLPANDQDPVPDLSTQNPPISTPGLEIRPKPDVAVPPPKPANDINLFRCFIDGAGLDFPVDLSAQEQEEAMKAFGHVFRHTVDGVMALLKARAEEKNEIRANVTLIQTRKNNPFKFLPTSEAAINVMLYKKYQQMGFLDPVTAIEESFADIRDHEIAMRSSIRASLREVIQKFDPEVFAAAQNSKSVFQSKKSLCWEEYCNAYPGLATEAMENLFKGDFAKNYEEQLKRMSEKYNKN